MNFSDRLSDRRYADEPHFPHLAMIGMVESRIERNGAIARERRYYLSSTPPHAKTFAAAARAHWGVENRLHWVLDVVFHDDFARLRSGNGPQSMAVVKRIAMNLVRNPKHKHSLKARRKLANLIPNYLETLIRQTPALT
jgi:predicted transposase YbfD/YdcC